MAESDYLLDDGTVVQFEIDPGPGFRPAGSREIVGRVREAVAPAVEAARVVLERVREASPDEVEVKFGVKVSGKANWVVARASTDANFEIKMTWRSGAPPAETVREEAQEEERAPEDGDAAG